MGNGWVAKTSQVALKSDSDASGSVQEKTDALTPGSILRNPSDAVSHGAGLNEDNSALTLLMRELEESQNQLQALKSENDSLRSRLAQEQGLTHKWRSAFEQKTRNQCRELQQSDFARINMRLLTESNWEPTVEDCLAYISALRPDRVHVLDSAWESAKDAEEFRYGRRLLSLLMRLLAAADTAAETKSDLRLAGVFSASEYAGAESKLTLSSGNFAKRRTFTYQGREFLMSRHLKIGIAPDVRSCIRVHFDFMRSGGRLLIGWCGEHLPSLRTRRV